MFLHGYLSSGNSFFNQINYFEKSFEIFAPDLKGFGTNTDMKFPYSLDDYIEELKEYFYKKGIVKPCCIAHSFGGRIAIKSAYYDSNFFDKIVLTGAAGLRPKLTVKKFIKKSTFNLLKNFVSKNKLKRFYSKDYLSLNGVMRESFIKIVNEHLDYCLLGIKNKTLIINGKNDTETPIYLAKRLNRGIENSKLVLIKNAGHFAFIDNPFAFNMEVGEFLLS